MPGGARGRDWDGGTPFSPFFFFSFYVLFLQDGFRRGLAPLRGKTTKIGPEGIQLLLDGCLMECGCPSLFPSSPPPFFVLFFFSDGTIILPRDGSSCEGHDIGRGGPLKATECAKRGQVDLPVFFLF